MNRMTKDKITSVIEVLIKNNTYKTLYSCEEVQNIPNNLIIKNKKNKKLIFQQDGMECVANEPDIANMMPCI